MEKKDLINQNLTTLKRLEGLTDEKFAEKVGNVSKYNMNKYLSLSMPPPEVLRAISKAFNLDLHMLYFKEMTRYNYKDFLLSNAQPVLRKAASEAEESNKTASEIEGCLSVLLDPKAPHEQREVAGEQLTRIADRVLSNTVQFYKNRKKLKQFMDDQDLFPEGL